MSSVFDLQSTPIEDGVTLIEASAGTGKTYCLTGLVLRLLLERRVSDVSELLVVTFTHAATQELVERIRTALRDTCQLLAGEGSAEDAFLQHLADRYRHDPENHRLLREALLRFDDLTVSTIHGFCSRVLDESAFESGMPFEAELLENDAPMLQQAARDVWRRLLYPAPEIVAAVASEEGWVPETFLGDYQLWRRHPNTEIVPRAAHLDTATARLEETHRSLAATWNLDAAHQLLTRRRFRRGSFFDRLELSQGLLDAETFCRHGLAAGLRAVKELTRPRLASTLFKKDQRGVLDHPLIAAITTFVEAIEHLRHALRCRFIKDVDALFDRQKRESHTLTYDDLLSRLRDALADPRRGRLLTQVVQQTYRAALIDEFQDTDLIQYDIFRRLFRQGPMVLIGDPKQAIYRFRGADVFAYLAAKHDADRCYTLERNWRTVEPLVEAVNAIFHRIRRPFIFERITFEPAVAALTDEATITGDANETSRPPLQWLWLPTVKNRDEARATIRQTITAEVVRLLAGDTQLGDRQLTPDDIAILVRTNAQAIELQHALREVGVPSVVGRSGDIFFSEEMADLQRLLAAIADPGYAPRLRAAWSTRLWGDNARAIRQLNDDDDAFARRLENFDSYREDWRRRGFMPMIQRLFAARKVRPRLLAMAAGERRLTNLLHAVEVLHHEEKERHLSPAALIGWLTAERARERVETDQTELRLESDAPAVQLSTVHRSKGLEYEIVFCPFLWEARTVDKPPVQTHLNAEKVVIDCGSDQLADHLLQAEAERLAEDLRLTYVALTRARHRCYVVWGDVGGKDGSMASALGYLLRPADHQAQLDAATRAFDPEASDGEWTARMLGEVQARRQGWRRQLEGLVTDHHATMALNTLGPAPEPTKLIEPPRRELQPRIFQGVIPRRWALESFSSLSRSGEAEAPDHRDPETPEALQVPPDSATATTDQDSPRSSLLDFARGRRAGSCLHHVLERTDFTNLPPEATDQRIAESLRRYGLDEPTSHPHTDGSGRHTDGSGRQADGPGHRDPFDPVATVRQMLHDLSATRIPVADVRLGEVDKASYLVEWKFTTPLARLSPRQLSEVFQTHARGRVRDDYAPRLAQLSADVVRGYLTGFVDLIFTYDTRWTVLDWKSNYLGPTAASYNDASMWEAMCHHHYVLQYHLYVFALHRYLRQRLPDYDYQRHIVGAGYVFLRAVGGNDSAAGWYVDQPPLALIEALDALIRGQEAA